MSEDRRRWTLYRGHPMTTSLDGPKLDLGEAVDVMPVAEHEARLARVTTAARDALDLADSGWMYAPEHAREQWDCEGRSEALRAVVGRSGEAGEQTERNPASEKPPASAEAPGHKHPPRTPSDPPPPSPPAVKSTRSSA